MENELMRRKVAIDHRPNVRTYPASWNFDPSTAYPEYPFHKISEEPNEVYDSVRNVLRQLGLDARHFGEKGWNPLGELVRPGQMVVLKPNLVMHRHPLGFDMNSVVTNGSVIRALLDYVFIALHGEGRVVIGDAPLQSCDFEKVTHLNGLDRIVDGYTNSPGFELSLEDFRREITVRDEKNFVMKRKLKNDETYRIVDINTDSMLAGVSEGFKRYRVTNYDVSVMARHHDRQTNAYFVAKSVLDADMVINIPKLKTHRKAGMTGALKNLVGINCHKDCLPHHRFGSADEGSDEYLHKNLFKKLATVLTEQQDVTESYFGQMLLRYPIGALRKAGRLVQKDNFLEGSWYGNDTIWRTVLDLNRILFFADKTGVLRDSQQRNTLNIVDAVVAGDHEGPIDPTPKPCGLILGGLNPVAVDAVCATMMGFDFRRIPQVNNAFQPMKYSIADFDADTIDAVYNGRSMTLRQLGDEINLHFIPTSGWKNHIELNNPNELVSR